MMNLTEQENKIGRTVQTFLTMGILFMLEKLLCPRHDCPGTCMDRMQAAYQVIAPLQNELGPVQGISFGWDGGLVVNVDAPMMLSLEAPILWDALLKLKHEGFNVAIAEEV